MPLHEVKVPDIGDFEDVDVVDVVVKRGDQVAVEDPLITLETDKAAMDIPAPVAGTIAEVLVTTGEKVSEGTLIATIEAAAAETEKIEPEQVQELVPETVESTAPPSAPETSPIPTSTDVSAQVVVLGSGPGGYTAAFRAADLGLDVVLIERWPSLGGVCLNVGCIPSKALLHAARVIEEAESMRERGIRFGEPEIDTSGLRDWKNRVVSRLTGGLATIAKQRKVRVVHGNAKFFDSNTLAVTTEDDLVTVGFQYCIIAAGSESAVLPGLPDDQRVMDSTDALELEELPERMIVIGGGIIGLEMACVYDALGVNISVVELTDTLMPGTDRDLVRVLQKRIASRYENIWLGVKVSSVEARDDGLLVGFDGAGAPEPQLFGRVLVSVGRSPNGLAIEANKAGVNVDERGFIAVDKQMRTNVPHIFAIGDIVGQPMLAHKATHEGKVAAEVISGQKRAFDARVIPSVAYTDPEVAWVGPTEAELKEQGVAYEKGVFPWAASGRALSLGNDQGFTKLLFDKNTERVIGAGIVGPNAGDLIAEAGLAIEMGADAADIGLTIHPHPTLSETVAFAAEAFEGTITDLYLPKK